MDFLTSIAEQKILKAMEEGDLNSSKWKNKPLPLEDDHLVPEDLKIAYKMLKNSGYLPPEVEDRKEIKRIEDLIAATEDEHERLRQMKKLNVLLMKVEEKRSFSSNIAAQDDYYRKVVEKISVKTKASKQ
ncbi:DnaJ family domain-containing protein [Desulforhopalus sp. 52FAK]